ncbi:hypothetical protein [Actinoplanes sp. NPDC026619]|uniref:hypothetical protein n=1 Tax=Actinoplanes sp. NPDC026619 TaxID=3155798 RepID=UPI003404A983
MDQERSESSQDPDQSTPHESDVSGPSKVQLAIVVAVGTLASFLGLTSFSGMVSSNRDAGDRLTDGIFLLVWCLVVLASYFAWEVGSFSELKRRGLPGIANQLFETVSIALHRLGKLLTSAGGIAAVLVVLSSITADPIPGEKGIAIFALVTLIAGSALQFNTSRKQSIVRRRISHLQNQMTGVGSDLQRTRKKLDNVGLELDKVTQDLAREYNALDRQSKINSQLSDAIQGDPKLVAAIGRYQKVSRWRSFAVQAVLVLVSFVIGYIVNWTDADFLKWLARVF